MSRVDSIDDKPIVVDEKELLVAKQLQAREEDMRQKQHFYTRNKIFKPPFLLVLFTLMNFWTYYDRGTMASVLVEVRSDDTIAGSSEISEAKAGALTSVFMAGFFATNPIFVALGGHFTAKQIIIFGLVCWSVACIGSGFSQNYWMLLACRACVGIGEAAYAGFTVTIIDNMAPKHKRTMWIGLFYSMLPVGSAMGMAVSGFIAADVHIGSFVGWRVAFIVEVIPMIAVIAFLVFLPPMYNPVQNRKPSQQLEEETSGTSTAEQVVLLNGEEDAEAGQSTTPTPKLDEHVPLKAAAKHLFTNLDFLLLAFGYGMYAFVLGAVTAFAISMLVQGPLRLSAVIASIIVGLLAAFTGLVGSIVGGLVVDRLGGSQGYIGVYKCGVFNTICIAISVPCGLVAMGAETLWLFMLAFVLGVFGLFAVTAPVSASLLTSVPKNMRTYSISFSIFIMHLIGDFPSPMIAGALSDHFAQGCPNFKNNLTCNTHSLPPNPSLPYYTPTPMPSNHSLMMTSLSSLISSTTTAMPSDSPHPSLMTQFSNPNCIWIPKTQHSHGYCANTYQLRDALMIVFAVLSLAVPAWGTVAVRMYRNVKNGIMNVDDKMRAEKMRREELEEDATPGEEGSAGAAGKANSGADGPSYSGLSMQSRDGQRVN